MFCYIEFHCDSAGSGSVYRFRQLMVTCDQYLCRRSRKWSQFCIWLSGFCVCSYVRYLGTPFFESGICFFVKVSSAYFSCWYSEFVSQVFDRDC